MAGQIVVVVDPASTGGCVAAEAATRGYSVIAAWGTEITLAERLHMPSDCKNIKFHAEVEELSTIRETADAVRAAAGGMRIVACIVGAETGVTLADHLSVELKVRTNGIFDGGDRRNKSVQQRAVKAEGLRAVREALGSTWDEVSDFVDQEPLPIVVKPVEGGGSYGVKLCGTRQEAKAHFNLLIDGQRKRSAGGAAVLCQEFLKGQEYVVDHVSCDGIHKCMMVWVYDKHPTNGAAFVYYGMIPVDSESEIAKMLIKYTQGVLDALKLFNGPSHGEVMMTSDGPCLVEMNCRSHGWDGAWVPLAKMLTGGYAQPAVALDSHVDVGAFAKIPVIYPSPLRAAGQNVMLVSFFSGTVRSTPGYDKMKLLPSFVALQTGVGIGSRVELTIDLFTAVGVLVLAHEEPSQLEADLSVVRRMEKDGLFTFDEALDFAEAEPSVDAISPSGTLRRSITDILSEASAGFLWRSKVVEKSNGSPRRLRAAVLSASIFVGLLAGKKMNRIPAAAASAVAAAVTFAL
eukprot:CAMPEP_0197651852 /NCGR_PEP_ID=MMETSP1338-20131121/34091_1 /TAXON_ID=43686 ORGANISM="Pelagodinium beii, Strain RCC1491" /NCGR_SAMPLE_ID=MMETSP1338 /ASSEMBLY_ACC=CAM_ASM_000754 /LENGTH=516 /DNA_ID=CAMNT_0043226603 /DNA_START=126 /DNA_END=1676 /DNA_ORIENTATION=-